MSLNHEYQLVGNNVTSSSDKSENVASYFFVTIFLMIAIGLLKGLLGQFWISEVGVWGLDYLIINPPQLKKYMENELSKHKVVYDENGWPVHPLTGKRHVRTLSSCLEVSLNSVFFLMIPGVLIYKGLQKLFILCCMCCSPEDGEDDDKLLLSKYDCECVYTKEIEEDDTMFVIKELERSKESLARVKSINNSKTFLYERGGLPSNNMNKIQFKADPHQGTSIDDESSIITNDNINTGYINTDESSNLQRIVSYLTVFEREASASGAIGLRPSQKYCVRGFTTTNQDGEVNFSPAVPVWQYWTSNTGGNKEMIRLSVPRQLNAKVFDVRYKSNDDVKKNGRLLLFPQYPCLNIKHQKSRDKHSDKKCCCTDD